MKNPFVLDPLSLQKRFSAAPPCPLPSPCTLSLSFHAKVLGRSEFKQLLRWRLAVKKAMAADLAGVGEGGEGEEGAAAKKGASAAAAKGEGEAGGDGGRGGGKGQYRGGGEGRSP